MKLDLHTHSTASDGQYTPSQMIEMAKEKELEYYALTDHDTIFGIAEAKAKASELGVHFIPGIEISTELGEEIHIVGLGIDETCEVLVQACDSYMNDRENRCARIVAFLNEKKIDVTEEQILEIAGDGSVGRPHFAQFLHKNGYVHSNQEAFDRYLNTTEFHQKTDRKKPTPQEAISLIHSAGGKAILAHPGLLKMGKSWKESLIHELADAGLDGLECFYFSHTDNQVKYFRHLAERYHLCTSCGSDFHGEKVKPQVPFGMTLEAYLDTLIIQQL